MSMLSWLKQRRRTAAYQQQLQTFTNTLRHNLATRNARCHLAFACRTIQRLEPLLTDVEDQKVFRAAEALIVKAIESDAIDEKFVQRITGIADKRPSLKAVSYALSSVFYL